MKAPKILRLKLTDAFVKGATPIPGTQYQPSFARDVSDEPCVYCGRPSNSWEHVIPLSAGGKNGYNRVRACQECNGNRSSTPLLLYLMARRK